MGDEVPAGAAFRISELVDRTKFLDDGFFLPRGLDGADAEVAGVVGTKSFGVSGFFVALCSSRLKASSMERRSTLRLRRYPDRPDAFSDVEVLLARFTGDAGAETAAGALVGKFVGVSIATEAIYRLLSTGNYSG